MLGDLHTDRSNPSIPCGLLLNQYAKNLSVDQLTIVKRLTRVDIQIMHKLPDYSQIHMPSQLPGISVLFAIPEERQVGVIKQLQDNLKGIEKKIRTSEAKLESIRQNLKNPMFLERASKEVCEQTKNDEKVVEENCKVLQKNRDILLSLIRENLFFVCLNELLSLSKARECAESICILNTINIYTYVLCSK